VILDSKKAGQLTAGDPVLFRGYRVGSVEKAPLIRRKAPSAISCSSMRQTIVWSPATSVSGKTAGSRSILPRRGCALKWDR
jgi:hypothetical protein